jgi:neutral ceramidase
MSIPKSAFVCSILLLCAAGTPALTADQNGLRVGAIRVDITPAGDADLPMSGYSGRTAGFKAIHDPLHLRTVIVDDGTNQAALVACEVIGFSNALWDDITRNLTAATGIPRENILLAAVHTHAAPSLGTYEGRLTEKQVAYVEKLKKAIVDSVLEARKKLQPAKVGFGTGQANVNMNRRARDDQGGWMLGNNPEGVSDKTVAVIRFDSLAGEPIALVTNYGVHGTVLGPGNLQISSDLPGATARFVEQHYGDKVVAPWTSGTAGDQDPIYRTGTDFHNVGALGRILGEEVIRVADNIKTSPRARVRAMQSVVTCPGKRTVQAPGPGKEYKYEDADPVSIRLSLIVINDIAVAGVSGEVLTNIGLRLKRESPFNRTIMVTHCNGSSGYLPDDAAYEQVSYEITTTRVKPGCAENAVVDGFLKMMATFF